MTLMKQNGKCGAQTSSVCVYSLDLLSRPPGARWAMKGMTQSNRWSSFNKAPLSKTSPKSSRKMLKNLFVMDSCEW